MSPLSIGVLAISMSIDAFVASVGKGTTEDRPGLAMTLRTGAIFGVIEAITPIVGWLAGVAASQFTRSFAPFHSRTRAAPRLRRRSENKPEIGYKKTRWRHPPARACRLRASAE